MALGDNIEKTTPSVKSLEVEEPVEETLEDDIEPFLFLRDLLTALDFSTMSLTLTKGHLSLENVPDEIHMILNLVPETSQLLALIPDLIEKIDNVRIVSEGALQAAAANTLAENAAEFITKQSDSEKDTDDES